MLYYQQEVPPQPAPAKLVIQAAPIAIIIDIIPIIFSKIKLELPIKYIGKKEELIGFLIALYSYFYLYLAQFYIVALYILFTTLYLDSNILYQFELTWRDFLLKPVGEYNEFIIAIFELYKQFEEELQKVFRDTDEKRYTQEYLA